MTWMNKEKCVVSRTIRRGMYDVVLYYSITLNDIISETSKESSRIYELNLRILLLYLC